MENAEPGAPCPDCGTIGRICDMTLEVSTTPIATIEPKTIRGRETWGCLHGYLALIVGIEAAIIFSVPIEWWARIIIFLCVAGITAALVLDHGPTQNLIARIKNYLENKAR
jgi:hypothetical protein